MKGLAIGVPATPFDIAVVRQITEHAMLESDVYEIYASITASFISCQKNGILTQVMNCGAIASGNIVIVALQQH